MRFYGKWKGAVSVAGLAALLALACGAARAAEDREILQAVRNGVPNTADNRVVLAELFSAEQ